MSGVWWRCIGFGLVVGSLSVVECMAEVHLGCSLSVVGSVVEVRFGCGRVVRSRSVVGLHPWCGGGALGCSQVVGSQTVVRHVAVVHLGCGRVVGSWSVVGGVVIRVWPLVGCLGGASAPRLV